MRDRFVKETSSPTGKAFAVLKRKTACRLTFSVYYNPVLRVSFGMIIVVKVTIYKPAEGSFIVETLYLDLQKLCWAFHQSLQLTSSCNHGLPRLMGLFCFWWNWQVCRCRPVKGGQGDTMSYKIIMEQLRICADERS